MLASCAPPYVWGSNVQVEKNLLGIVPAGSVPSQLLKVAARRGWKIEAYRIRTSDNGGPTYLDGCSTIKGGEFVPSVIDEYHTPFLTSVEAMWIFDASHRLRRVCVRKTVDAL